MKNDELNQQVHEAMGGCWHDYKYITTPPPAVHEYFFVPYFHCTKCGLKNASYRRNDKPDYCGSLDAIREFENFVVICKGSFAYIQALFEVVADSSLSALLFASPEQRARAGLEVLDLPEKSEPINLDDYEPAPCPDGIFGCEVWHGTKKEAREDAKFAIDSNKEE